MARANIDKGVQGQTVKPFNGTRGIFIPYSLLDSLHGDYYAAAIVSQLFYWMQVGNENMWKLQTKKEISKQLRMEYKTFSRHLKKLIESGIVIVERRGIHNVVRLNQDKFALLNIDEVAQIVDKMSTNSGQNVYYIEDKMSTEKTRPQETTTETTNSGQNVHNEVDKMSTNSGQNVYYIVDKMSTNSGQNVHFDKPQSLQPQQIAEALDSNKIHSKIHDKIKNKNILSKEKEKKEINKERKEKEIQTPGDTDSISYPVINFSSNDSRIHEQEPTDIRKPQPGESNTRPYLVFESPIVRHLIKLGFPRKSLRSEDDRKELDEILAKCDENVSVMLQKLETLAKERHIRLYEYLEYKCRPAHQQAALSRLRIPLC